MNDLDTEPAPVTPVSPNKRKFSFRFPSAGHHEHDSKNERRNFSDEAQSITDIQVCDVESTDYSKNSNENEKIYCCVKEISDSSINLINNNNNNDYVDMSGNKKLSTSLTDLNKNKHKTFNLSKFFLNCRNSKKRSISTSECAVYDNVVNSENSNISLKRLDSCPSKVSCAKTYKSIDNLSFNYYTDPTDDNYVNKGVWI